MTAKYKKGSELFRELLKGSQLLADNVGSTLGPKGHTVLIGDRNNKPVITKDGVTVAQFVKSDEPFQQLAIDIIKQASDQTNVESGDGTSTSTIIANALLKEAHKFIVAGVHPFNIKKGIDDALEKCEDLLLENSHQIDSPKKIQDIAYISSNGDKAISEIIRRAVEGAGADGAITIEESHSKKTVLKVVEGFTFDSGIYNPVFVTDEKRGICKFDNPYFLITDQKISSLDDLMPVLELVARDSKPLVIVAEEFEGDALAACVYNASEGNLPLCLIKAPRYGEERRAILEDLAIASGGKFFRRAAGESIRDIELLDLGRAESVEANKYATIIVDARGDKEVITERIEVLREEVKNTEKHEDAKKIQERVARLASTIAIIRVGADTEIEMTEKKHRVEDALEAVVSAQEKGYVPGGGVTLLRIADVLRTDDDSLKTGYEVFKKAIQSPFEKLCANANHNAEIIKDRIFKSDEWSYGYDFRGDECADLLEVGVIDPTKVSLKAVRNAVSAATTLLTTSYSVVLSSNSGDM